MRLEWEVPDLVLSEASQQRLLQAVKEEVAVRLYTEGEVSSGYAARLLGIGRFDFIDLLSKRGIPFLTYTEDDAAQRKIVLEQLKREQQS